MGFFDKLLGGKASGVTIGAPLAGQAVPLQEVSDPTFGQEILGKGVAILPREGKVFAPFDGTVDLMFDTGHAVNLVSKDGVELLIHVGLDTVQLKGQHYTAHVQTGQTVQAGQLLLEFDAAAIADAGYDVITPIVVCNTDAYASITAHTGPVEQGEPVLTLKH